MGRVEVDQVHLDLAAVAGVDRPGRVDQAQAEPVRPAPSAGARSRRSPRGSPPPRPCRRAARCSGASSTSSASGEVGAGVAGQRVARHGALGGQQGDRHVQLGRGEVGHVGDPTAAAVRVGRGGQARAGRAAPARRASRWPAGCRGRPARRRAGTAPQSARSGPSGGPRCRLHARSPAAPSTEPRPGATLGRAAAPTSWPGRRRRGPGASPVAGRPCSSCSSPISTTSTAAMRTVSTPSSSGTVSRDAGASQCAAASPPVAAPMPDVAGPPGRRGRRRSRRPRRRGGRAQPRRVADRQPRRGGGQQVVEHGARRAARSGAGRRRAAVRRCRRGAPPRAAPTAVATAPSDVAQAGAGSRAGRSPPAWARRGLGAADETGDGLGDGARRTAQPALVGRGRGGRDRARRRDVAGRGGARRVLGHRRPSVVSSGPSQGPAASVRAVGAGSSFRRSRGSTGRRPWWRRAGCGAARGSSASR